MKKMKLKSILTVLMVALVSSGISVAAVKLTAKDIGFTSTHEEWEVSNVEDAMNDLYNIGKYEITPDTYFYDSTTSGEEIVRYKKVDGKYYLCDKNGDVTTEEEQDVSNLTLVEYTGTTEENLSVGKAGFANSEFILGNGSDINSSSGKYTKTATGTVGSTPVTVAGKILYVYVRKYGSTWQASNFLGGSPSAGVQTRFKYRSRDDGYYDALSTAIQDFDIGTLSNGGKTFTFNSSYNGYSYTIYY